MCKAFWIRKEKVVKLEWKKNTSSRFFWEVWQDQFQDSFQLQMFFLSWLCCTHPHPLAPSKQTAIGLVILCMIRMVSTIIEGEWFINSTLLFKYIMLLHCNYVADIILIPPVEWVLLLNGKCWAAFSNSSQEMERLGVVITKQKPQDFLRLI